MKIQWREAIEFLAIECKRTHDARSNYAERAIGVAPEQYRGVPGGRVYGSRAIFCFCKNK